MAGSSFFFLTSRRSASVRRFSPSASDAQSAKGLGSVYAAISQRDIPLAGVAGRTLGLIVRGATTSREDGNEAHGRLGGGMPVVVGLEDAWCEDDGRSKTRPGAEGATRRDVVCDARADAA